MNKCGGFPKSWNICSLFCPVAGGGTFMRELNSRGYKKSCPERVTIPRPFRCKRNDLPLIYQDWCERHPGLEPGASALGVPRAAIAPEPHLYLFNTYIPCKPTTTNIVFQLESNPLYRSGTNAHPPFQLAHQGSDPRTFGLWTQHTSSAPVSMYSLRAIDIQCTVALLMFVVVRIIGVQVVDCWVPCVLILCDAVPVEGCITLSVRLIRWPLSHDNITQDIRVDPIVDKDDRGCLNGKTDMEGM